MKLFWTLLLSANSVIAQDIQIKGFIGPNDDRNVCHYPPVQQWCFRNGGTIDQCLSADGQANHPIPECISQQEQKSEDQPPLSHEYPIAVRVLSATTTSYPATGLGSCQEPGLLPHLCTTTVSRTAVSVSAIINDADYQLECRDRKCFVPSPGEYPARMTKDGAYELLGFRPDGKNGYKPIPNKFWTTAVRSR